MSIPRPSLNVACRRARAWISRALDDDLDEASRLQLEEHIGTCPECERHREVLQQGRTLLRASEAEPSENFEWKVQLGIQRALRERAAAADVVPSSSGRFWRPAMASAAAVALLVIGAGQVFLPGDSTVEAPTAPRTTTASTGRIAVVPSAPEPDLRRAVPGVPIEVDATRSRFGIRTVGSFGDDRFIGDPYDALRRNARMDTAFPTSDLFREVMIQAVPRVDPPGFLMPRQGVDGALGLNRRVYGSRLRASSGPIDSSAGVQGRLDRR